MRILTRALAVALSAGTLVLASLAGGQPVARHCQRTFTLAEFHRAAVLTYRGVGLPPRGSYGDLWRYARCQRSGAIGEALRMWRHQHDAWRDRRHPAVAVIASGGLGDVPGVPYSFASCVAFRESTDGELSPNIYGILPMNGYYSGMSVAAQKVLFAAMYARDGVQPWRPWDGCTV